MFETTLAGSLPKPSWLATPNVLWAPWTLTGQPLFEAKDDATLLAIRRQEEAGLDIVSDGEQARQHFVHGFLAEVDGVDFDRKVRMGIRNNRYDADCPTVTGPLTRRKFVHEREARVARAATARKLKFTLPGPMTLIDTLADGYYGDRVKMAFAFAELLNQEAKDLERLGVDVVQFDEPAFNVYLNETVEWGVPALEKAAEMGFEADIRMSSGPLSLCANPRSPTSIWCEEMPRSARMPSTGVAFKNSRYCFVN